MKRIVLQKPPLTLVLVVALAVLLALLAFLQYQWLGRISAGEGQIMQTSLRSRANALREELTAQIERVSLRFQINAGELNDAALNKLSNGYAEWKSGAAFPELIKNVFAAASNDGGLGGLKRLDQATGRFEPVDWPAEFAALRNRFSNREGFFNGG